MSSTAPRKKFRPQKRIQHTAAANWLAEYDAEAQAFAAKILADHQPANTGTAPKSKKAPLAKPPKLWHDIALCTIFINRCITAAAEIETGIRNMERRASRPDPSTMAQMWRELDIQRHNHAILTSHFITLKNQLMTAERA